MIRKCCVTNFNGNCNAENKVKTFRLPQNSEESIRWITIIPKGNIPDSIDAAACEKGWPKDYPIIIDYGKLRPRDPNSVFGCIKSRLLPTVRADSGIRHIIPDELHLFEQKDRIEDIDNIQYKLNLLI